MKSPHSQRSGGLAGFHLTSNFYAMAGDPNVANCVFLEIVLNCATWNFWVKFRALVRLHVQNWTVFDHFPLFYFLSRSSGTKVSTV